MNYRYKLSFTEYGPCIKYFGRSQVGMRHVRETAAGFRTLERSRGREEGDVAMVASFCDSLAEIFERTVLIGGGNYNSFFFLNRGNYNWHLQIRIFSF